MNLCKIDCDRKSPQIRAESASAFLHRMPVISEYDGSAQMMLNCLV